MGLIGDIEEAKGYWSKSSYVGRAIIIWGMFLMISSMTSLSGVVFQWKGFIKDGMEFYQNIITVPILSFFQKIGITINHKWLDLLILVSLMFGGMCRNALIIMKGSKLVYFPIIFYICSMVFLVYSVQDYPGPYVRTYIIVIFLFLFYPYMFPHICKNKLAYYTPFIISVTFVLFLGAVNSGLTR